MSKSETCTHNADTHACTLKEKLVLNPIAKLDATAAMHSLNMRDSFGLRRHECEAIQYRLEPLVSRRCSLYGDRITVDSASSQFIPSCAPCNRSDKLFAVKVRADEDCLRGRGSLFAFGTDLMSDEIRLRIIA